MKKFIALVLAILTLTAVCIPAAMALEAWQVRYGTADLYTNTPGDVNHFITNLQTDLNSYGDYGLDTDGYYGPLTKAAVKKFQQEKGLDDDGIAGDKTKKALYNAVFNTNF